jgi:two-component system sensor histidine kinase HupT/HoxJ
LDESGDWVEITFADTGPGIPVEVLPHIFEPFFTTKSTGSGLGLAVSYGIIERHGGLLTADSRPGEGTMFSVRLPAETNGDRLADRDAGRSIASARNAA